MTKPDSNNTHFLKILNRFVILAFCFGIFILSSCDRKKVLDESFQIPYEKWNKNTFAKFVVPITDTLEHYDFYINIRNTVDYRFANIYLFLKTTFPGGKHAQDTLECILAGPDGKWLGKGLTKMKENRILLKKGFLFPRKGNYTFEIEQAMRVDELEGIADIGIRIQKQ